MCHKQDICLVLLVGIPGSGKTFFSSFLENYVKVKPTEFMKGVQFITVRYDDYCKVRNPNDFSDCSKWKDERRKILNDVENIIVDIRDKFNKNIGLRSLSLNEDINIPGVSIILIDDNMYYRSMRYEYYKIAKTYNLSFCQLFFSITLDQALTSNSQRLVESQIPENVIMSMFEKIEPPDQNHDWEKHSLHITSYMNFSDEYSLNSVLTVVKDALSNPVVVSAPNLHLAEAQQITNRNSLHQIDNILKQLVGTLIKNQLEGKNNYNVQELSKEYSNKRLSLLKEIKEGLVILPVNLSEPFNHNSLNVIKQKLLELLKNK